MQLRYQPALKVSLIQGNNLAPEKIRKIDGFLCALGCVTDSVTEFVDMEDWLTKYLVPAFPILLRLVSGMPVLAGSYIF